MSHKYKEKRFLSAEKKKKKMHKKKKLHKRPKLMQKYRITQSLSTQNEHMLSQNKTISWPNSFGMGGPNQPIIRMINNGFFYKTSIYHS